MTKYILPPVFKRLIRVCYHSTFFLIAFYAVFFLAIVFSMIQGWLEQDWLEQDWSEQDYPILMAVSHICVGLIFICVISMTSYAIGYVCYLWKLGYRGEAIKGLVTFCLLNILAGYIWFYQSEIKNQEIRFSLFRLF